MGWLFGWDDRKSLIDHLVRGNGVHTHAHCLRGNNLWAVQEYQGKKFIALYLLRGHGKSRDGWGYKDMDESMGPYYYNCPLGYLNMVDEPHNDNAHEWREAVREWYARRERNARVNGKAGNVVQYGGRRYRLLTNLGRKGWGVRDEGTGYPYRMKLSQLKEATLWEPEAHTASA